MRWFNQVRHRLCFENTGARRRRRVLGEWAFASCPRILCYKQHTFFGGFRLSFGRFYLALSRNDSVGAEDVSRGHEGWRGKFPDRSPLLPAPVIQTPSGQPPFLRLLRALRETQSGLNGLVPALSRNEAAEASREGRNDGPDFSGLGCSTLQCGSFAFRKAEFLCAFGGLGVRPHRSRLHGSG